jgi:hypothetical protein
VSAPTTLAVDVKTILKVIREVQDADACLLGAHAPGLRDRISTAMQHHRNGVLLLTQVLDDAGVKKC